MIGAEPERLAYPRPHFSRRNNRQRHKRLHRIRMIQNQPISHPRAAVVTYQAETVKTEMLHDDELIAGHGPLGIGRSVDLLWTPAVPIAPESVATTV